MPTLTKAVLPAQSNVWQRSADTILMVLAAVTGISLCLNYSLIKARHSWQRSLPVVNGGRALSGWEVDGPPSVAPPSSSEEFFSAFVGEREPLPADMPDLDGLALVPSTSGDLGIGRFARRFDLDFRPILGRSFYVRNLVPHACRIRSLTLPYGSSRRFYNR